MNDLAAIVAFVKAAEQRSFTGAARLLGVTASGVGKTIGRLEEELGVRLLHRTTRRVQLTDEGAIFFERCRRVVEELEAARASISHRDVVARGKLRVSMPSTIGKRFVVPMLPRFVEKHPELELDVDLNDRRVNLVEEGYDVALRIGVLHDASLVARVIGQQQILTIASPSYPNVESLTSLGELSHQRCIVFRMPSTGRERPWGFRIDGRAIEWRPKPAMTLSDGEAIVAAVEAGLGIAQVPSLMAHDALSAGRLVELMHGHRPAPDPISAVFPSGKNLPARTRAFVEFLAGIPGLAPTPSPKRRR